MSHLHRLYTRHAAEVWRRETEILASQGLVRPPAAVQWLVTSACDLSCPHCYSGAGRRQPHELTTEEAKRAIIDELAEMTVVHDDEAPSPPTLVLAGGELLLRRDIPELVAYAALRGVPWAMHTHGAHVPKHRAWLEQTPPRLCAISLDGEVEAHDAFRGKAGSHAAALQAVRLLREIGCREVVIGTTVTRHNADALADLFPIVRDSGAHSWGLHLFAPEGRGSEHLALFPSDAQLRRVVAFAKRARQSFHVELCNEWGGAGADDPYVRDNPFACGAGRISCVIGPRGELLPCTTTDLKESEGNVREHALRELWLRGFARFRRHGSDPCGDDQECWLQSRNGNACRQRAFGSAAQDAPPAAAASLVTGAELVRVRLPVTALELSPPRFRLSGPGPMTRARTLALASLMAQGCTTDTPLPKEPATTGQATSPASAQVPPASAAPPEAVGAPLAARAAATAPEARDELPWPEQLDADGVRQRYRRVPNAQRIDPAAPLGVTTIDALDEQLQAREGEWMFHANVVAQIWAQLGRRLGEPPPPSDLERTALVELSARMHRHARVVDTLLRAEATTGPVEFLPWRSKAGSFGSTPGGTRPDELLELARELWPNTGTGTWETDGCVEVELRRGTAWRLRGGVPQPLALHVPISLCRLDLVVVTRDAQLADCCLGLLQLPPDVALSPWEFGASLSPAAQRAIDDTVARALDGNETALASLSGQLAQSQAAIRRALLANPERPGAAALRQLLWSWDR